MASKNEYSEALKGTGPIPIAQGIYEMSSTANGELGTPVRFADGRVFRYAKAGATALAPGKLMKAGVVSFAAATNKAVNAAVGVGLYAVTLQTASAYTTCEEGYLQINDAAGEGIQYKIKEASANATTAVYTDLTLYDPIATALTTSSEGTIIASPYEQIELCSAITDIIIGVSPITVTAEYYFWIQTWGVACVLADNAVAAGVVVEVGVDVNSNTAGTTTRNADTAMAVGVQMLVGITAAAGEYKPVWLTIAP